MSEPKSEDWEEKVAKIVKTQMEKTIEEKLKPQNAQNPPSSPPKHEHLTSESVTRFFNENEDCPECKAESEKLRKNIVKDFLTPRKDLPLVCEECGTPVEEEEEKCPTCGNTNATRR